MSSRGFSNARYGSNRGGRSGVLPSRFKCHVGGEWKDSSLFSKNQHAKWFNKKRNANDGVTPENAGLTCRVHSGEPSREIKCHGHCGLWKERDKFSSNQRRVRIPWCKNCIRWASQQETLGIPTAPPNSDLSPDEMLGIPGASDKQKVAHFPEDGNYKDLGDDELATDDEDESDPDLAFTATLGRRPMFDSDDDSIGYDDDDDEEFRIIPNKPTGSLNETMSALSINRAASQTTSRDDAPSSSRESASVLSAKSGNQTSDLHLPPHLRTKSGSAATTINTSRSDAVGSRVPGSGPKGASETSVAHLPPHLRTKFGPAVSSASTTRRGDASDSPRVPGSVPKGDRQTSDLHLPPHLRTKFGPAGSAATSTGNLSGPSGSTATTNTSRNFDIAGPPGFAQTHLRGGKTQSHQTGRTLSTYSTGSRADLGDTWSTDSPVKKDGPSHREAPRPTYHAYGPGGEAAIRRAGPGSSSASTSAAPSIQQNMPRRPDRNGWARPDTRKQFTAAADSATKPTERKETYDDSDSSDEF